MMITDSLPFTPKSCGVDAKPYQNPESRANKGLSNISEHMSYIIREDKRRDYKKAEDIQDETQKITPAECYDLTRKNISTMKANNDWMASKGYRTPPENTEGEREIFQGITQPTGGSN